MAWAPGKVILIGEHAVVFGQAALAGALARGVTVDLDRDAPGRLRIPGWAIDVAIDGDHPVAAAIRMLLDAAGVAGPLDFGLRIDADVPAGAGLGSSAALAVAVARAVTGGRGGAGVADIERIAAAAEARFHGRPSGIDVAVAAHGGLGLFRKATGWQPVAAPPVPLAIGLSGEPKSTAEMLDRVAQARAADPDGVDRRMAALGRAAEAGAAALVAGDLAAVGPLLSAAHDQLAAIGLSTPGLDRMVAAALDAGALGAKLTGAGGGGAVIALAPGREQVVVDAWRAAGRDGFACDVGVAR